MKDFEYYEHRYRISLYTMWYTPRIDIGTHIRSVDLDKEARMRWVQGATDSSIRCTYTHAFKIWVNA